MARDKCVVKQEKDSTLTIQFNKLTRGEAMALQNALIEWSKQSMVAPDVTAYLSNGLSRANFNLMAEQVMDKWEQKVKKAFPNAKGFYAHAKVDHSVVPSVYGQLSFDAGSHVTFADLQRLSSMFGTTSIDMGAEYEDGCDTCGGTNKQCITVKNITVRND